MSKLVRAAENQIRAMIQNAFDEAVARGELSPCAVPAYRVETPTNVKRGDLAVNAAFMLGKPQNRTPQAVAAILAKYIRTENTCFGAFEAAEAGFINFFFDDKYYAGILLEVRADKNAYGCSDDSGKDIAVGFLPAKGDMPRSAAGAVRVDCLADIFIAAGYRTKRVLFAEDAAPDCFSEYRVAYDIYKSRPPCETDEAAIMIAYESTGGADCIAVPAAAAIPAKTPVDYLRFICADGEENAPLIIDHDIAVEQSSMNPVYFCRYAHARICSIFEKLKADGITVGEASPEELALLISEPEKALITHIAALSGEIREAAAQYNPARITQYAVELASRFHKFYNAQRVIVGDEGLMRARLTLCDCTRIVMKNVLTLLKIDAPEKM